MLWVYGMRMRPCGIGCQPNEGFVAYFDDKKGKYWNVALYTRKLAQEELVQYEMDYIGVAKQGEER